LFSDAVLNGCKTTKKQGVEKQRSTEAEKIKELLTPDQ
jgi:hypothetical protein